MNYAFSISFQSPLGTLLIQGTKDFIQSVEFREDAEENLSEDTGVLLQCKKELGEYFSGRRRVFSVALQPEGTDFQKRVWLELLKVPFGDTDSYTEIAKKLKNQAAVRAVGLANGKNPVAIIIPCHRIIGDNGKLTGYAGGLWRKQWLLEHEGNTSGKHRTLF